MKHHRCCIKKRGALASPTLGPPCAVAVIFFYAASMMLHKKKFEGRREKGDLENYKPNLYNIDGIKYGFTIVISLAILLDLELNLIRQQTLPFA